MFRPRFTAPLAAMALTTGLALVGCQFLPGTAPNTPSPSPSASASAFPEADLEGCEHMNEGTAIAVTAAASDATSSPTVSTPHQRYTITLPSNNGQFAGKVTYNSGEEADYVFFFDRDVTFKVTDAEDKVVAIEESASSSVACTSIKGRHVVPLAVGPYTLHLGPTAASTVSLVIEEAAH